MELTKTVIENLGKVFLNLGQGMILGTFVSTYFTNQVSLSKAIIAHVLGVMTLSVGIYFLSYADSFER